MSGIVTCGRLQGHRGRAEVPLPKRRGGHGRHGPAGGPRGAGGGHYGRNQAGFPGPFSTASDFGQNQAGFPGPVSADSDFRQRALSDTVEHFIIHNNIGRFDLAIAEKPSKQYCGIKDFFEGFDDRNNTVVLKDF